MTRAQTMSELAEKGFEINRALRIAMMDVRDKVAGLGKYDRDRILPLIEDALRASESMPTGFDINAALRTAPCFDNSADMVAVRTLQAMDETADADAKFLRDRLDSVARIEWHEAIKSFRRQIIVVAAETAVSRPNCGGDK